MPVLAAVVTAEDLTVLVTRVQPLAVVRIERQGPHRRAVVRNGELFPVLSAVRAAVGAVLRPYIYGVGVLRVGGNGTARGPLRQAPSHPLPPTLAPSHPILPCPTR